MNETRAKDDPKDEAIVAKDSEIKARDSKIKARSSEIKAQDSEIRAQDSGIGVWDSEIRARDSEIKAAIIAKDNEMKAKKDALTTYSEIQRNADLQQKASIEEQLVQFTQIQSSTGISQSWSIPREKIQTLVKREIGRGAWGVVYSGTFRGEQVAIKCAHREIMDTGTINILKRGDDNG